MLTREQILAADDLKSEVVPVPEWGGEVRVGMMSGARRDAFEDSLRTDGALDLSNRRAKLVAAALIDEQGNALFTSADIEALGRKSMAALDRVTGIAQRLNKLGDAELEQATGN